MRIVLATPLYPPEIGGPAPYVKELAKRLSKDHKVVVVAYSTLPEAVTGVRIVAIDKRVPLLVRLFSCMFVLLREARRADIIYAQNGASLELPAGLVALISGVPLVLCMSDKTAKERAEKNTLLRAITGFAAKRARGIQHDIPFPRPEILPFEPRPDAALAAFEQSWQTHLETLRTIFEYARR